MTHAGALLVVWLYCGLGHVIPTPHLTACRGILHAVNREPEAPYGRPECVVGTMADVTREAQARYDECRWEGR